MLEIKHAVRKQFPVDFEQVTLENINDVAKWCGGTVEKREQRMLGTTVELPVIAMKGQGDQRGKSYDAALGCFVVELKGSFRVYKPAQFAASFDVVPTDDEMLKLAEEAVAANMKPVGFTDLGAEIAANNEPGLVLRDVGAEYGSDYQGLAARESGA